MATVAFKKGMLKNLPNTYTEGMFYITTDERAIYLDVDNSTRIRLGDFQEFATLEALNANTNPSTTALYYVAEFNVLAKWDGTKYVRINLDTGATDIEVTGSGNAVTSASYDASTRKITLTKGETYMTSNDVDNKIVALDLANTYYSKTLGEANAAAITGIKDGESIDSFADVESKNAAQDTAISAAQTQADKGVADAATAKNAADAAQATADAKVASVSSGNNGIEIGGTATAPTVSLKLSAKAGNQLGIETGSGEEGLYLSVPAAVAYSLVKDDNAGDYAAVYHLTADGVNTGAAINIPKDMVVSSGSVVTDPTGQPAGTYIKLVLANADNDEIFINVGDLIEYVTSGSQTGDMIVVNVDSNHQVTATITDGTVTLAKLESSVQTKINQAHDHSNKALLDTYTQTEADLADAVSKKHEHSNKAELDLIASGDKAKWDGAVSDIAAMKDGTNIDSFGDVESALDDKADLASPTFTGTPTAPTAASGTNNTQVATTAFVQDAVSSGLTWGSF